VDLPPPLYADYVLEALVRWRQQGLRTALLTLVARDGSSPRPPGSQMAVAEDGQALGAISGGCAEQALIHDALTAIGQQTNRLELYGKGSKYKDIVLPCGSGIHVFFDVTLSDAELTRLTEARRLRQVAVYSCDGPEGRFHRPGLPAPRVLIFGQGPVVGFLAQMARLSEFEVIVHSPDAATRAACTAVACVHPLPTTTGWDRHLIDAHTGVISLFHEHDYEPDILEAALASDAFYIAALGSRRTHQQRLGHLKHRGWDADACARIHGPAGLPIGAKSPPEIAVSIVAQLIACWRQQSDTDLWRVSGPALAEPA